MIISKHWSMQWLFEVVLVCIIDGVIMIGNKDDEKILVSCLHWSQSCLLRIDTFFLKTVE